jgi:hypothetical protein
MPMYVREFVIPGILAISGVGVLWCRFQLAADLRSTPEGIHIPWWRRHGPIFLSLLGQALILWSIIHVLHHFGIKTEPAVE